MMPEDDPTLMTDELLSHWSSDSAYVGDSEQLCPSILSNNMTRESSPSSDCGFVGRDDNSPDFFETTAQETELYNSEKLDSNLQDDKQWPTEDESDEREAQSLCDRAEELYTSNSNINEKECKESSAKPKEKRNHPEFLLTKSSKSEIRCKAEKHHSKTTPVKLSIFQTNSTSEGNRYLGK